MKYQNMLEYLWKYKYETWKAVKIFVEKNKYETWKSFKILVEIQI